jgi:hypothetical protein
MGMTGCTHRTPINSVGSVTVYTTFENKIPGKFAIIVGTASESLDRTVEPASHICSGWSYPLEFTSSFATSMVSASSYIFEEVTRSYPAEIDNLKKEGYSGYVLISVKHFEPRLMFIPKMFEATGVADANIGFDYSVRNINNKVIVSGMATASRTADGSAGGVCERGSELIQTAVRNALQTSLEQYVERVANSENVRKEFTDQTNVKKALKNK